VRLLTVHVAEVAVSPEGASRAGSDGASGDGVGGDVTGADGVGEDVTPEDATGDDAGSDGGVTVTDALIAVVGVERSDLSPVAVGRGLAAVVADRARQVSASGVVCLSGERLVRTPAPPGTTDATLDALADAVAASWEPAAPGESGVVARGPADERAAVSLSVRDHPHAVVRHDPPVEPSLDADEAAWTWDGEGARPAVPATRWRSATDPPGVLREVPGVVGGHGTWLPAGVTGRAATVAAAVGSALEAGALLAAREDGMAVGSWAPPPATVPDREGVGWHERDVADASPAEGCWVERRAPGRGRPEVHARGDDALERVLAVVADAHEQVGVDPVVAVRGTDARCEAVAAAVDRPVLAAEPGDAVGSGGEERVLDVAFGVRTPGGAVHQTGRVWASSDDPGLVHGTPLGTPTAGFAAAHAAAARADRPLPVAVAPTQCRLVPVDGRDEAACLALVDRLREAGVRADCDDRALPVGRRLDRLGAERVPYHAVVGARERDGDGAGRRRARVGPPTRLAPAGTGGGRRRNRRLSAGR
jgi:hypothetical protein